jgi:hypothetical protein
MDAVLRKALENEKAVLEAKYVDIDKQLTALRAENEAVSARLSHIVALLKEPGAEDQNAAGSSQARPANEVYEESDPVEIAYSILDQRGQDPVHYKELADLVRQKGGILEGSNPALVLVSRLVTDDRFVRPFRRGYYALRKYYPKAKNVGCRRRRSHKRQPSRRTAG